MNDKYELYHFGIKGMRWGVRRYQNEDGSLTPAGKKRVSAQYKKLAAKAATEAARNHTQRYADAYNKAAEEMNNGGIDRYNARQRKKYGKNYADRDDYESGYMEEFGKLTEKYYNMSLAEFYQNNTTFKKGRELVDKYKMTEWDELARSNELGFEEATRNLQQRKKAEKGKSFADKAEKAMAKEILETYDEDDPDREEAMALLEEILES